MEKDLQKRITELLEEKKTGAGWCLSNVEICSNSDRNFISYCEGRLRQATHTFENLKEICLDDISLETYVAMMKSTFETFKYMLDTMVEPIFGKDTSNYGHFEGRVDEIEDTLNLLQELMKQEKNNKKEKRQ